MAEELPGCIKFFESLRAESQEKDEAVTHFAEKRFTLENRLNDIINLAKELKSIGSYSKYIDTQLLKLDELLMETDAKLDIARDEYEILNQECKKAEKVVNDAGWRISFNPFSKHRWHNINESEGKQGESELS